MDSFCLLTAALTWKQWCSAQGPQCSHNEMVKDLSLRDTPGKALGLNFKMDWGWDPELSPRPHVPSQAELWILDLPVQPCSQSDFLCSKSSKEGFNQGKALLGPIYRPHLSSAPFSLLQELWPQARYQMQVCVPEAQWGQTDLNIRVWCRERFIAGPSKGNGWLMLKKHQLLDGFQGEVFIGKIWGEGCKVCDFPLTGWWWGNWTVLQESGFQPEVTTLHLGGDLSSCRRTQRYCYVHSFRKNREIGRASCRERV